MCSGGHQQLSDNSIAGTVTQVNDFPNCLKTLKSIMFADDTSTYASNVNLHKLVENVNKDLLIISDWFKTNKLALNISKTSFMFFTKWKHTKIKLFIDGTEIEEKLSTKFLGIIINSQIKCN